MPSVIRHDRTVPSALPVASQLPSGAAATAVTVPVWPVRLARSCPVAASPDPYCAVGAAGGLLAAINGAAARLARIQRGQFAAACWAAQIHMHIPDPKPGHVAPREEMPGWQQETGEDIFKAIEQAGWIRQTSRGE